MDDQLSQELLGLCDQIDAELSGAGAGTNPPALARIQFLCGKLSGRDSHMTTEANRLSSRAAIYLSNTKHLSVRGGADEVLRSLRALLASIRQDIRALAKRG